MTPEERQMLADLFERIRSTSAGPRDPQAEAFINDAVRALPFAPYVLAQTVLVQTHALEAATQRIAELENQVRNPPAQETSFLGGLGRSLFGGGPSAPSAASQPQTQRSGGPYDASGYQRGGNPAPNYAPQQGYAPQPPYAPQPSYAPQPGPWGSAPASGGFLGNALRTATGVAGGMLAANAVESLFSGRSGGLFGGRSFADGGFAAPSETINNYYENADPAGQHAQDVLQDMDQDQDDAQDAQDDGGWDDNSSGGDYDT